MNATLNATLVASICALLTACETTGNPREGGLFGWSREKAQDRQIALQTQAATATAARDAEQAALRTRQADKRSIEDEIAQLDLQVRSADRESLRLENQLAQLAAKNRVASERERALLLEVRSRRAQREASVQREPSLPAEAAARRQQLGGIHDYNARMSAAILRMLAD